jgi:hypothetical protein
MNAYLSFVRRWLIMEMKMKTLIKIFVMVFALAAFTFSQGLAQPKSTTNGPVIKNAYAIQTGRFGDAIKLYLDVEDPNGDMLRIATVPYETGYGRYTPDWVYLKPQYGHRFVGYLQWNTYSGHHQWVGEWAQFYLEVSVFDKAGNESKSVVFPVQFVSEVTHNPAPPAPFDQGDIPRLGYIYVNITGDRGQSS